MKKCICFVLLLLSTRSFAQSFDNNVYNPAIKSVEFYNTAKVASFPVIALNSKEQVLLAFDDLRGSSRNYYYTIQHCDSKWNLSNISPAEYLQGFAEDQITDYTYSTNTKQKYTHYELKLPNANIIPKIAGNYILKVYESGDQANPILTRRLYIVGAKGSLSGEIVPTNNPSLRQTNQKINFQVDLGNLQVQNPNNDVRALIMQNGRSETGQWTTQPSSIRGSQLVYDDVYTNDFAGRNEFRHFDTRTLKLKSDRIGQIYRDTSYTVMLLGDPSRNLPNYSFLYDNDGNFFILNQDGYDAKRDGDYAHVYFSLAANKTPQDGDAYIVGRFNDFKIDERSKLQYEPVKGRFYTDLFLKQGVYDYQYVWVGHDKKPDDIALEGNYFETENEYQILVYYRPASARWEELIGYRLLNNKK
ncbi:MAG: DUF5103 domain-containing protein [Mucilaginibacter sp.]